MEASLIRQRNINDEMRDSYLDYAMSVIVSRALPDARDGLKPVHRRILYAMNSMGSGPSASYRKSARIVGEVLGKYHPHSDVAVYDAMVRMAQDFSMRYELVDGQGNFGSIDGDSAAAMRYTEARLASIGGHLLDDISKNTVDFGDNFDGSLREPLVLPSSIPNLLVNGSSGIAVGMSTSVPPHNLGEVCDALVYLLDNWDGLEDIGVTDLMQFIKGPDFPTGGLVYTHDKNEEERLISAYATGRGKLTVRAKAHLEDLGRGRTRIIITEIPFQINKSSLIERIVDLAQKGKVEGLSNMRDESDREGLRIVIELTRNADASEVLADLYKYTPLESTFSVIMLALVDDEPRMLSLKQALRIYIEHRLEVIRRRSEYDLANAEARAHILEGLLLALDDIDKAIAIIRRSRTPETASKNLQSEFGLSEAQAKAILDMRLRRLAALERKQIKDEHSELLKFIKDLKLLLSSAVLMRMEVKRELKELRENFVDHRRTAVIKGVPSDISAGELLVPAEKTYIALTPAGLLSRTYEYDVPKFRKNATDPPTFIHASTTADTLYLFTPDGRSATIPVSQITQATNPSEGDHFSRLCDFSDATPIVDIVSLPPSLEAGYLFFTSRLGEVKRLRIEDLPGMRVESFDVFDVEEGDELICVDVVFDEDELVLVSFNGQAIRFSVDDVRPTGLSAGGMRGIRLKGEEDYVAGAGIAREDRQVLVLTADGRGKRTELEEYPTQGRGGGGVRTLKASKGQPNDIIAATVIDPRTTGLLWTNLTNVIAIDLDKAPEAKRDYRGDFFVALTVSEEIVGMSIVEPPLVVPQNEDPEIMDEEDIFDDQDDSDPHFSDNGKDPS